jgi:hypothetical protein
MDFNVVCLAIIPSVYSDSKSPTCLITKNIVTYILRRREENVLVPYSLAAERYYGNAPEILNRQIEVCA